jgi:hypothetical protein
MDVQPSEDADESPRVKSEVLLAEMTEVFKVLQAQNDGALSAITNIRAVEREANDAQPRVAAAAAQVSQHETTALQVLSAIKQASADADTVTWRLPPQAKHTDA